MSDLKQKLADHPLYKEGLTRVNGDNEKRRVAAMVDDAATQIEAFLSVFEGLVKKATEQGKVDERADEHR